MSVPNGLIINSSPGFYNEPVNLNIKVDTSLYMSTNQFIGRVQSYYGL